MKINKFFIVLIIILLGCISCDTVGLGSKLNLVPPEMSITKPDFVQNIKSEELIIEGFAEDLQEIVNMSVIVEYIGTTKWEIEFYGTKDGWQVKKQGSSSFVNFDKSSWNELKRGYVEWSINADELLDRTLEGEYLITATAENNVGNVAASVSRRVVIDNTAPKVKILFPEIPKKTVTIDGEDTEVPLNYTEASVILDAYELRDLAVLSKIHNRSLKIQYEVDDNFSIDTIEFMLADNTGDNIYYTKKFEKENATWSGNFTIEASEIKCPAGKQKMQIISTSSDRAGNKDSAVSHGWLVWWPDADKPWSDGIGDITDNTETNLLQVYPGSVVYGNAYDNQGVESITYSIYGGPGYSILRGTNVIPNIPMQAGYDPSKFFTFGIRAPEGSGKYKIEIITTDIYGVTGEDEFYFFVFQLNEGGPLLRTFSAKPGTYGRGQTIEITLNLREPVDVTGSPRLKLNVNKTPSVPDVYAVFDSGTNNTQQLRFTYQAVAGDSTPEDDVLKIISIDLNGATIKRADGSSFDLTDEKNDLTKFEYGLEFYTNIRIITTVPILQTAVLTGTTLTLTYDKQIYKGTGYITLTQENFTTAYRAPAVLTKDEYLLYGGDSVLGTYYEAGINGVRESGGNYTVDTAEKYILKYEYDPDIAALRNLLTDRGAHSVTINIVSQAVRVGGTGDTQLIIDLGPTYGFTPKVKGVNYVIAYPRGFVVDNQSNQVEPEAGLARAYPGVNDPVIRVRKDQRQITTQSFSAGGTTYYHTIATQQFGTEIKIHCQTPGSSITYAIYSVPTNAPTGTLNGTHINNYNTKVNSAFSGTGSSVYTGYASGTYSAPLVIGPSANTEQGGTRPAAVGNIDTNNRYGYIYGIRATVSGVNGYALAARSVVQFSTRRTGGNTDVIGQLGALRTLAGNQDPREVLQIWIFGGDDPAGGDNKTPGFPLSWSEDNPSGARLFTTTQDNFNSGTGDNWYWISWDVNATAYFHFIAGTTLASATNNAAALRDDFLLGPRRWCWGKNRWAFQYETYALHPGGSISMNRSTTVTGQATDYFEFFDTFKNSRPGL